MAEVDLRDLAPYVAELVAWLAPDEYTPELVGMIRAAPDDVLALERFGLAEVEAVESPWTLDALVLHALVPLGALSLVDGQPMIPKLAELLGLLLTDPRLGPCGRDMTIRALAENVVMEGRLDESARGCE